MNRFPQIVQSRFQYAPGRVRAGLSALARRYGLKDGFLLLAVVLGIFLGAQGLGWGRYDCLNLDKMAFKNIFAGERRPFEPATYVKPPFYTYLCHFAARVPAMTVSSLFFWKPSNERYTIFLVVRTILARALNLAMFALCVLAVFMLVREFYSTGAARVAALVLATSAGFVPYQIFLTTDLAVTFMMLASFLFAVKIIGNPSMRYSVAAGLLAGLAAATKYNGLAVAAALPMAHLLAGWKPAVPGFRKLWNPVAAALRRRSAWVCGLCVPLGFLIGNPYALIDWPKFKADFLYNYTVTPVYSGLIEGTGYAKFFHAFYEIFGVPGTWLLGLGLGLGVLAILSRPAKWQGWPLWLSALAVFALYTWKIGAFPRVETRFVLPAAPFFLLLAAAGFPLLLKARLVFVLAITLLLAYNLASGWWTGRLFAGDPRNAVPQFAATHLQNGGVVEWSKSNPRLEGLPKKVKTHEIKTGLERAAMFKEMFENDPEMLARVGANEVQTDLDWFSIGRRKERNPDYVIWCDIDLDEITRPHYDALFGPESGYRVVYDARSPILPDWVYPRRTEFTRNRTTIWEKTN